MKELTIGEVARQANLNPSALRYYEKVGLVNSTGRVNGQRRYHEEVLKRLAIIRLAQQAGFTVTEMQVLFGDKAVEDSATTRWKELAQHKLIEVEALLEKIRQMKQLLIASLECGCLSLEECDFIYAAK